MRRPTHDMHVSFCNHAVLAYCCCCDLAVLQSRESRVGPGKGVDGASR